MKTAIFIILNIITVSAFAQVDTTKTGLLKKKPVELKEVVVKSHRIISKADKFVMSVPMNDNKNGEELLRQAPSVVLNGKDITINGEGGTKVFVNDREIRLINNSDKPIENGKVIIFADTDNIIFEKKNVEPKHGINCIIPNYRPTQSVKKNDVSESFRNPINPTATKKLYDFYVKAPSDVTEFKLNWKLESLKEPKYGSVTVKWQSEIENKWTVVKQDDERDGSSVIEDFLLDE